MSEEDDIKLPLSSEELPATADSLNNVKLIAERVSLDKVKEIESTVEKVFADVLDDYKEHFNGFLVAYARRLCSRVIRYMDVVEKLEDELMTPKRIDDASNVEIIRYLGIIQTQMSQAIELIKYMVSNPTVNVRLESKTLNFNNTFTPDGIDVSEKSSREAIRSLFTKMLDKLPESGPEDVELELKR